MCSFALRNPADGYLVASQEIGGCASRAASATTSELGRHCPSPQVVDLEDCFYMIGQRHLCPQCKNPTTKAQSVTFNSWDPWILAMLPLALAAEFPAEMNHRSAISADVFTLMCTCFNYGVGSKQFSHILLVLHHQHFAQMHVQYLNGILARQKPHLDADPSTTYEAFSDFADRDGYGRFVPSSS
jgi:hypothetical protein